MTCERQYIARAVAALEEPTRPLFTPDRAEQMAAIEILLASSIPSELRRALHERESELATRKVAA